jgi:hypothetical protein
MEQSNQARRIGAGIPQRHRRTHPRVIGASFIDTLGDALRINRQNIHRLSKMTGSGAFLRLQVANKPGFEAR